MADIIIPFGVDNLKVAINFYFNSLILMLRYHT